jgi:hypothetical protein
MLPFPDEFLCFGLTLVGVAVFHQRNFEFALAGLTVIALYKVTVPGHDLLPVAGG